jgi:Asp-tRNA(Asn)/Glu-tRNA(Gln) amidotransferase B subunit
MVTPALTPDRQRCHAPSIDRLSLAAMGDAASIGAEVEAVLAEFSAQVGEYRAGKSALFGFLVGQAPCKSATMLAERMTEFTTVNDELRRRLAD